MYNFRIVYSTNVNFHYGDNPSDTAVTMTVSAPTFSEAETKAWDRLRDLVIDPYQFEIVSLKKV